MFTRTFTLLLSCSLWALPCQAEKYIVNTGSENLTVSIAEYHPRQILDGGGRTSKIAVVPNPARWKVTTDVVIRPSGCRSVRDVTHMRVEGKSPNTKSQLRFPINSTKAFFIEDSIVKSDRDGTPVQYGHRWDWKAFYSLDVYATTVSGGKRLYRLKNETFNMNFSSRGRSNFDKTYQVSGFYKFQDMKAKSWSATVKIDKLSNGIRLHGATVGKDVSAFRGTPLSSGRSKGYVRGSTKLYYLEIAPDAYKYRKTGEGGGFNPQRLDDLRTIFKDRNRDPKNWEVQLVRNPTGGAIQVGGVWIPATKVIPN